MHSFRHKMLINLLTAILCLATGVMPGAVTAQEQEEQGDKSAIPAQEQRQDDKLAIPAQEMEQDDKPAISAQEQEQAAKPSIPAQAFDAVVVRPVMLVMTAVSTATFFITLPFTGTELSGGDFYDAREALVTYPVEYTFKRPLGDLSAEP